MNATLLAYIAAAQALFFVALFVVLVGHRVLDEVRAPGRAAERARFAGILRSALMGATQPVDVVAALPEFRGATIASVLHDYASQIGGASWDRVAQGIRGSGWMDDFLLPRARSRFWWNRLVAARLLAILGTDDDESTTHLLIGDSHPAVRLAAIPAIQRIPAPDLLETVLAEAMQARPVVRRFLFDTLVDVRTSMTPLLADRLVAEPEHPDLRMLVILAGELGVPDLLDGILHHRRHAELEIRVAVARALSPYPHPRAADALMELLRDDGWQVRTQAASSLGTIRAVNGCDALRDALSDDQWWVRLRAGIALRQIGPHGAASLREASGGEDRYAADMAHYVLGLSESAVGDYVV